jgi:hypothetical protein
MPRSERQEQQQNKSPMKEKTTTKPCRSPPLDVSSDRFLHKEISH